LGGARPLSTQDNTKAENILAYIHASNGIRTHDLSIKEGDDTVSLARHGLGFAPRLPGFDPRSSCGVYGGQSSTEMNTRNLPEGKGRRACEADNLTAICDSTV
jgi:hypothetical protein